MLRKSVGALLVVFWVLLAGVDVLEDLNFAGQVEFNGAAKASVPGKPASLANNIVESANHSRARRSVDLPQIVEPLSLADQAVVPKKSKLHKLHRVFLI